MSKHTVYTQTQGHFAQAVHADIKRSVFNRPSTHKTTFNAGTLTPIYIDEVLPGDTFEMDMAFISRLTTPIFPTMDNIDLDFYAFFVPNRIVWDGWQALCGENTTGAWAQTTPPALVPMYNIGSSVVLKSIGDYYGHPLGMNYSVSLGTGVSVLPMRGYGLIYNEWFRDQNLQAPLVISKGNTPETATSSYAYSNPLLKVNKKHDYFTSCLPAPQKGASQLIPIELNELIPVITGNDNPSIPVPYTPLRTMFSTGGVAGNDFQVLSLQQNGSSPNPVRASALSGSIIPQTGNQILPTNLWADGRNVQISGTTISELRTLVQIQKLFEKDGRGGTRYIEMLKAHFGVDAQDYRLQRPEFLGHCNSLVGIHQVPQTSSTDTTSPQGNLAAYGYSGGQKHFFKKSFVEHGFVHIFAVARQTKTYQNGLDKFWSRRERFDFYYPTLAHISEQPVLAKEIYASTGATANNAVFGYQEAWADYRFKPNRVSAQMRSAVTNSFDIWHYADKYTSHPLLSAGWIEDNSRVNIDRTLAVKSLTSSGADNNNDQIIIDIAFKCKCTRPMPVNSIPGFMDHF